MTTTPERKSKRTTTTRTTTTSQKSTEGAPPTPPASLAVDPDQLRAAARQLRAERVNPVDPQTGRPKRGRPRKDQGAAAPVQQAPVEIPYSAKSLADLHLHLWRAIAKRLRSRYEIGDDMAAAMGDAAKTVIEQYLGPALGKHSALAAYSLTQIAALVAVLSLSEKPIRSQALPAAETVQAPAGAQAQTGAEGFTDNRDIRPYVRP